MAKQHSNLNDKWAVVTGASTGIGRDIAVSLAREGFNIAFSYARSVDAAKRTKELCEAEGRSVFSASCDVGAQDDVKRFFSEASAYFRSPLQVLVNNAGTQVWSPLLDLSLQDWEQVIRTNLTGCFLNTQSASRLMAKGGQGGAIINIGSGCNKLPFPHLVSYTASKGGIEMFTKSAAIELGRYDITVNCVAPGAIEIERTNDELENYGETWSRIAPLGRVGKPSDISDYVVFLAGEKGRYMTGQTLFVDGGAFTYPNWPGLPDSQSDSI